MHRDALTRQAVELPAWEIIANRLNKLLLAVTGTTELALKQAGKPCGFWPFQSHSSIFLGDLGLKRKHSEKKGKKNKKAIKSKIIYSQVLSFPVCCINPLLAAELLHGPGPSPLAVRLHEESLSASFPAEEENTEGEALFSSVSAKGTHSPDTYGFRHPPAVLAFCHFSFS